MTARGNLYEFINVSPDASHKQISAAISAMRVNDMPTQLYRILDCAESTLLDSYGRQMYNKSYLGLSFDNDMTYSYGINDLFDRRLDIMYTFRLTLERERYRLRK